VDFSFFFYRVRIVSYYQPFNLFRFFQGIGASLLAPQVLASIKIFFNESERSKASTDCLQTTRKASAVFVIKDSKALWYHLIEQWIN